MAVKETGSFHLAAKRLNLSQSAVTRRVQKLEQALDSVLFERTTRAVKPTLSAKRLQARAEAILDDANETVRAMRDESVAFAYQRGAIVTVATIPTVISSLFPKAIGFMRQAGITSRVRLIDTAANEVAEAVAQGEADFGICSIPLMEPNATFEALFDDPIGIAVPTDHPLAELQEVQWEDLKNHTLVLPARGTGNRLLIDEAMALVGHPLAWTYEVSRTTTALEFATGGLAVALLPRSATDSVSGRNVAWRSLSSPQISRPIGLLSRIGQSESTATVVLKNQIRKVAQSLTS